MKKFFLFFFLFLFSFFGYIIFAQDNGEPGGGGQQGQTKLINIIKGIAYALVGLFLVIGSYKIITSEGEPGKVEEGKKTIIYALIGLGVALVAEKIADWLKEIK